MNKAKNKRYLLEIHFKTKTEKSFKYVEKIKEDFSTKKELKEYKKIIDNTVSQASVTDNVTGKFIEFYSEGKWTKD